MVEVGLALGVAAIGVVGVMAILPFALKTTQNSSREAYLGDAASFIFSRIDAKIQKDVSDQTDDSVKLTNFQAIFNSSSSTDGDFDLTQLYNEIKTDGAGIIKIDTSGVNKTIAFYSSKEQTGQPEFEAVYKIKAYEIKDLKLFVDGKTPNTPVSKFENGKWVYTIEEGVKVPQPVEIAASGSANYTDPENENNKLTVNSTSPEKTWVRVYLELSWPKALVETARQKRTFVKEYFYNK